MSDKRGRGIAMLSQLYIENIAVIRQATIDFSKGFHVFTGETGAGKTILISRSEERR